MIEILVVLVIFSLLWGSYRFSLDPTSHSLTGLKQLLWARQLVATEFLTAQQQPTVEKSESVRQTKDADLPSQYLLSASTRGASVLFHSAHLKSVQTPYLEQLDNTGEGEVYNTRVFSRLIAPSTALAEKHLLYGGAAR